MSVLIVWSCTSSFQTDGRAGEKFIQDKMVIQELFSEQHPIDSALSIHLQGLELSNRERFQFLREWVLPNDNHTDIRLEFDFAPTYPLPKVSEKFTLSSEGGYLVAPALDLIKVAEELKQLDQLAEDVRLLSFSDKAFVRDRLALELLIGIENADTEKISDQFSAFIPLITNNVLDGPSDAEWLVFSQLQARNLLKNEIGEFVYRYAPWARNWYHPDPQRQQWLAMIGRSRRSIIDRLEKDERSPEIHDLKRWSPVAKENARFSGEGRPPTQWDEHHGYLENISSYFDDFLFYDIPLQGNFEVECDIPPFDWRETSLLVAGKWISPYYNRKEYEIGTFDRDFGNIKLPFQLTKDRDWMRYRVTVRDLVATTYVNGRKLHAERLSSDYAPWLAVRSSYRQDGGIRNLRITGNPVIPNQINLLADPQIASWSSYFQDPFGEKIMDWWIAHPEDTPTELIVRKRSYVSINEPTIQGEQLRTFEEQLLQYCRPLLEDGMISYEFFHHEDSVHVDPALGRLVFLIRENGVSRHWVTNGQYDRTQTDPANMHFLPDCQQSTAPLPFRKSEWNRVQLELRDNEIFISLNGIKIYQEKLSFERRPRFGFFHYGDQTSSRIRNVIYEGQWPKQLPSLDEQEMAFNETEILDKNVKHLAEHWGFDFTERRDWANKFSVISGDIQHDFEETEQGLIARRKSEDGYRNATISPRLQFKGDFDITVEYDGLESETTSGGYSSTFLLVNFDTTEKDEHFLARRQFDNGAEVKQECHCAIVRKLPNDEFRRHFSIPPCEEGTGKLRLIRLGETMYYLTSEQDSPFFQLRGQTKIYADDSDAAEVSLISQMFKKGQTSVTWQKFSINAEELTGLALEPIAEKIAKLNQQREELPTHFFHDFTKKAPDSNFEFRADLSKWSESDRGWKITTEGQETWYGPGFHFRHNIDGDFDIELQLEVLEFPDLSQGGRSAVYLQTQTVDRDRTYLNAIFRNTQAGFTEATGQYREKRPEGYGYPAFGIVKLADVSHLRLCRRGDHVYLIVKVKDSEDEILVGEQEFPALIIPKDNTRVMVNTGGEGLKTVVLLKSFEVQAATISPGLKEVNSKSN